MRDAYITDMLMAIANGVGASVEKRYIDLAEEYFSHRNKNKKAKEEKDAQEEAQAIIDRLANAVYET